MPDWKPEISRQLSGLRLEAARELEIIEEVSQHLDDRYEELLNRGCPEEEARRSALSEMSSGHLFAQELKRAEPPIRREPAVLGNGQGTHLENFFQDLRYALRMMRKNLGFTALAVLTLALGIGANTAIFSAVDSVLVRPLPYRDAGRLVMIWDEMSHIGFPKHFSTPAEWHAWRQQNTVFTDIAATQPVEAAISGDEAPEQLPARKVTANFWAVLGTGPLLGRGFTEEEDAQGAAVAVISHGLWQRRFGGARDVLGRKIILNDRPFLVVGVLPPEFYFLPARDIEIWIPTSFSANFLKHFSWHDLHCVARLKPGVTLQQARAEMAALSLRVSAQHVKPPRSAVVTPLREELAGKTHTSLLVLLCAAGAVLLIACLNLANLLLSRGVERSREAAVRAALGAQRGRLISQFLVEGLALAGFGAVVGVILAVPGMRFLETMVPETMAAVRLALDWRVLAFSAAITLAAGLIFGVVPAFGWSRVALHHRLRDGGRGSSGVRSHRLQHSLIVIETALAAALLTCGGLLLQTFQHLRQMDLGIRTDNLLTFVTPLFRYRDFDRQVAFVKAELEQIRAVPGVVSAGAISRIPLTAHDQTTQYVLAGQAAEEARGQDALSRVVTRDYFDAVGARLREGRFFDISDRRSPSPVAIVNESFADRNFPGRSPLGMRFQFGGTGDDAYWYTIIGVVKEIRDRGVAQELKPAVYRVHEQADQAGGQPNGIVVRTAVDPASILPSVRQAIWSIDKNQPITRVQTVSQIVARQLSAPSQNTALLSAFALLALLLASVGLYGVLSCAVTQRANEIGVRMALGATSREILLFFGGRGLKLTLAGLAIGLLLSIIAARLMTALFYGFRPDYLPAVGVVSLIFLAVATLACFVPARRAAKVDPMVALRCE